MVNSPRRIFDVIATAVLLMMLALPMAIIALIIVLTDSGPALFEQVRVGRDGRRFTMYKFRSMRAGAGTGPEREMIARELRGEAVAVNGSYKIFADPRITRIGAVLRKTSLDELPQLFNVLRGDMALVGPRPCLAWEAAMFPVEFAARFSVPPGITGLWQVSGRNQLSTLDMLRLDVTYVRTRSFRTDLRILVRTLPVLLRGDGAR